REIEWKAIVENSYLVGLGTNWSNIRNQLRKIYTDLQQKVWVMNVIPVHAPNTLPVVFERGLIQDHTCKSSSLNSQGLRTDEKSNVLVQFWSFFYQYCSKKVPPLFELYSLLVPHTPFSKGSHSFQKSSSDLWRCKHPIVIVVEMDHILRPGGWGIIHEKVEILDPLEKILRSLHWKIRMTFAKDKKGLLCAQKTMWRP
ncbi:hypothetical protein H5410_042011, partial [Solanum commersonii]